MSVRIIPRLDIKGPNLIKGIHLEGLRTLGKPEEFANYYYKHGADELIYVDTVASLYGRNNLLQFVRRTAKETFIPLTVGGGFDSLEDIRKALRAGADKVAINTAAIEDPELIERAAEEFGSSTIVLSIEAIKRPEGYKAFTENGREPTGKNVYEWAMKAEELGAGEILLTSVDREGRGEGYELELTKKIAQDTSVPVIAHGGAGSVEDIEEVIKDGKADAVSMASILHYEFVQKERQLDIEEREEGNIEFLKKGNVPEFIEPTNLTDLKAELASRNIDVRKEVPNL